MPVPKNTRILVGDYSAGYTLSASYANLTIMASASITGAAGAVGAEQMTGGLGGDGLDVDFAATTRNAGRITGGVGGVGGSGGLAGNGATGGAGGYGAYQSAGLFVNSGVVVGGAGGVGGDSNTGNGGAGGNGGVGLYVLDGGVINRGQIIGGAGGAGGAGFAFLGSGGLGGAGVVLGVGGSLTNLGSIAGGLDNIGAGFGSPAPGVVARGAIVTNGNASNQAAEISGDVAVADFSGVVTNFGILNGVSVGALTEGGTIFNQGVMIGGVAGAAEYQGGLVVNGSRTNHTATLYGEASGFYGVNDLTGETLVNYGLVWGDSGAGVVFTGAESRLVVEVGSTIQGFAYGAGGTLEFGAGKGQVSGFGSQYVNFGAYQVDAGGAWKVSGVNSMDAGLTIAQYGRLQLGVAPPPARTTPPGASLTIDGAVVNDGVLATSAGTLTVDGAVTGAGSVLINGGTAEFDSSFSQHVRFGASGGELILADSQAYTSRVFGFSTQGQTALDLRDIGFDSPTFKLHARGGVLTVSDGTHTAVIHLAGQFSGVQWNASDDGFGGVMVTASPPPAPMASAFSAAMASVGGASHASASLASSHSRLSPALLLATPGR